jgi:hypothetical protein
VPQQIGPYHSWQDVAQPIGDRDRQFQKALHKRVRGSRALERPAAQSANQDAQVVADYGLARRTVRRADGRSPLEPPGVPR